MSNIICLLIFVAVSAGISLASAAAAGVKILAPIIKKKNK